jgi:hypothetical protein
LPLLTITYKLSPLLTVAGTLLVFTNQQDDQLPVLTETRKQLTKRSIDQLAFIRELDFLVVLSGNWTYHLVSQRVLTMCEIINMFDLYYVYY